MYKTAVYTPVNGVITHQKQLISTLTLRQCHAVKYEIIAIFKALSYINKTPETPL